MHRLLDNSKRHRAMSVSYCRKNTAVPKVRCVADELYEPTFVQRAVKGM